MPRAHIERARLATAVADLLAELHVWPAVRLVGSSAEACHAAAEALAALPQLDVGVRLAPARGSAPVDAVLEVIGDLRGASALTRADLY